MMGGTSGSGGAPIAAAPSQVSRLGGFDPHPVAWSTIAALAKGGGLVLLFVGTLVMVLFGSYPASCFTSACSTSTSAGLQYSILFSRILWTVGAFAIAAGAGIQRQFVLNGPTPEGSEASARFLADRRTEFVLFLFGIVLLLVLLLSETSAIAPRF